MTHEHQASGKIAAMLPEKTFYHGPLILVELYLCLFGSSRKAI